MKYIIMCGGDYNEWEKPRQLTELNGESVVSRTIRLLKEQGITDIAISSNCLDFAQCGVELLGHTNRYEGYGNNKSNGLWTDAFYPINEPACYIFGDVVFSPQAIKTIIDTETDDIELFASAEPFGKRYFKRWAEPFALKVQNQKHLRQAIQKTKELAEQGKFWRKPIMWELWQVIKGTELNKIITNYTVINDYTCDIDSEYDIGQFKIILQSMRKPKYLIHAMPKRMWYVEEYLIPSMIAQGIAREDIQVYNDEAQEGNLRAWINSTAPLPDDDGGTWHLQDDVIISSKFKETTEIFNFGIVCGFRSFYDEGNPPGAVIFSKSWFSFLCIRIPNKIAKECAEWIDTYMIGNPVYKQYWEGGVNDDWFFRQYVSDYYKDTAAINLNPNIVDHIDYLIGGTVNSSKRIMQIRSKHWEDEYLVTELERKLKNASEEN